MLREFILKTGRRLVPEDKAILDKPTLLLVANYPSNVGYAWWLMEDFWCVIAEEASARGWHIILAYPLLREVPDRIGEAPIECVELPVSSSGLSGHAALQELVRRHRVKVVYLTDRPYRSLLYLRLRWWGVRHIVMHDHMPGDRPQPSGIKALLKRAVHAVPGWTCDRYIGVSRFIADRFTDRVCLPRHKCGVVLNGIEPSVRDAEVRRRVRQELGVSDDELMVISCGRLSAYKRVNLIVSAAALLKDCSTLRFFHVGNGPEVATLKAQIAALGQGGRFTLLGNCTDTRRLMQGADIAVHASQGEAFSLAILEFMDAALATVVPDNSGNREAVSDGEDGLVVADGDSDALATAVRRLVNNPEFRRQLGEKAREKVKREFTLARARRDLVREIECYL